MSFDPQTWTFIQHVIVVVVNVAVAAFLDHRREKRRRARAHRTTFHSRV